MQFLPKSELTTLEELAELAAILVNRGVRRIRLTGGEPLVRRNIPWLVEAIGRHLGEGLDEITMTTNATQLAPVAHRIRESGVRRFNISLDSLNEDRFRAITRRGDLRQVLGGIAAARRAGLAVKINMVALKDINEDEVEAMVAWCGEQGFGLTLIETMPRGPDRPVSAARCGEASAAGTLHGQRHLCGRDQGSYGRGKSVAKEGFFDQHCLRIRHRLANLASRIAGYHHGGKGDSLHPEQGQ